VRKVALFFILILTLSFPVAGNAQDAACVDVDTLVEQLNAQCPIGHKDVWGINSFTMVGDRYALVDVKVPASLSMILSSFSDDTDNVKRLWIKELKEYGEEWNQFVDKMVEANRRIIINLHPEGSKNTALITLLPSDFNKTKPKE